MMASLIIQSRLGDRMEKVLVTGSQGFIGSYLCSELLKKGYSVFGMDNYSKYGAVVRAHDTDLNFSFMKIDLIKDSSVLREVFENIDPDYIIHAAARIGGISYFHKYASDLLLDNLTMDANVVRSAIGLYANKKLKRFVAMSSSMVYENTNVYPTTEASLATTPPPSSTYGFSKLALEYQCKGAWEQYKLPYTICRPFNCVGIGEEEALGEKAAMVGNIKMLMSHVLPDLIYKALHLNSNDKMPILGDGDQVRHYTNGKDLATGIIAAMESENGLCNDFNLSSPVATTVKELAEIVWRQIHGTPLQLQHHDPFTYDVQIRSPDVTKAKDLLGFETKSSLEESVSEVIDWMRKQHDIK